MALSGKIAVSVSIKDTRSNELETAVATVADSFAWTLADGTGDGQADLLWADQRTIAASGSEDIDLAGVLTNIYGGDVNVAELKALIIKADSANTNNVRLTRPASNGVPIFLAASDGIDIKPGGCFIWIAPNTGVAVTADTGDLIHIANSSSGTGVTYDIILLGASS